MAISIHPPVTAVTDEQKWKWAQRADTELTLLHNFMGKWHTAGKTAAQYSNLPARVRARFPYSTFLSEAQWNDFVIWHHRVTQQIHRIMHETRPAQPNLTEEQRAALQAEVDLARGDTSVSVDFDSSIAED